MKDAKCSICKNCYDTSIIPFLYTGGEEIEYFYICIPCYISLKRIEGHCIVCGNEGKLLDLYSMNLFGGRLITIKLCTKCLKTADYPIKDD